jgi:hypothetical protein
MAKKQPPHEDQYADLTFPERGVQDGQSVNFMPQGFTPVGYNVRLYESLTGRARGGSRSGLSKFIPEQHSGDHEIQHLTTIVTVDGALLGRYYTGLDQTFPGLYGGIGFLEQIDSSSLDIPGSDSGYQPAAQELRTVTMGFRHVVDGTTTLGLSSPTTISISTPAGSWADINLYVRVVNQDGNSGDYLVETVRIHTDAPGGPEDGESQATQFDTIGPPLGVHGVADFEVESAIPQTVLYFGTNSSVVGHKFTSRKPVRVRFTPYRLSHRAEE